MTDDWTYGPTDPADGAYAPRPRRSPRPDPPVGPEQPSGGPEPARTPAPRRRHPLRLRADPGARSWALLIDGVLLFVVGFVLLFVAFIASTPFWDVPDASDGVRQRTQASGVANASVYALNETVPRWVSWVILALLGVLAVLLSGAMGTSGRRRSLGLTIAELRVVRWPLKTTDPTELPHGWSVVDVEPDQVRVAARWVLPLLLFSVLSLELSGLAAGLITLACWAPCLVGQRRSLYDMVAGVAVVDAVRLAGLETEVRAVEGKLRDPDRLYPS